MQQLLGGINTLFSFPTICFNQNAARHPKIAGSSQTWNFQTLNAVMFLTKSYFPVKSSLPETALLLCSFLTLAVRFIWRMNNFEFFFCIWTGPYLVGNHPVSSFNIRNGDMTSTLTAASSHFMFYISFSYQISPPWPTHFQRINWLNYIRH